MIYGCRIPKDFFITKGKGESDITIHAGSFHLALKEANIEHHNIITYSSILPDVAKEIKMPTEKGRHGSVMECIMAVADCKKGEFGTAGIIFGWLYDKKTNDKKGGLVCEYHGELDEKSVHKQLRQSLNELYINGYSKNNELKKIKIITETIKPKKQFGTALVSLCFVNYIFPEEIEHRQR